MARFKYKGIDRYGSSIKGSIEAANETEARKRASLMGIKVKSVSFGESSGSAYEDWKPIQIDEKYNIKLQLTPPSVSFKEVTVFTRQLSVLINAGVSVIQSLEMMATQTENEYFKKILLRVRDRIKNGEDFADALSRYSNVFDTLYSSLVRAGTAAGALDAMLLKLSGYLERSHKLRRQFIGAISYPLGVLAVAIILVIFMLVFVVPMFEGFFSEAGQELPAFTQLIVETSRLMIDNIVTLTILAIAAFFAARKFSQTTAGRKAIDRYMLKVPLFGSVIIKIALARFATTMSTLVSGGVALIEAIGVCAQASANVHIEAEIYRVKEDVAKGVAIADSMEKIDLIPKIMSGMIRVGEASGQLDQMFEKVAQFYEEEVDSAMAQVLKLMEPILFIVIGGLVGIVLIAMYLPIFDLAATQMGGGA